MTDTTVRIVNLIINILLSVGGGIYLFDGWEAALFSLVAFAILNTGDALFDAIKAKWESRKHER